MHANLDSSERIVWWRNNVEILTMVAPPEVICIHRFGHRSLVVCMNRKKTELYSSLSSITAVLTSVVFLTLVSLKVKWEKWRSILVNLFWGQNMLKILVKGLTRRHSGNADSSSLCVPLKCSGKYLYQNAFSCNSCLIWCLCWCIWCGGTVFCLLHAGHQIVNCILET